jgi:predicted phosphoadenosine phosphosulfate sulfurtransferase
MKVYKKTTVLEEALTRINMLFDEFPNVVVGFSGGKDSTVCLNLALQVAEERGRLPLPVVWIDQEAEWQGTVDYVQTVMEDPRVKPYWFQMPMVITNNASSFERYSYCWAEGKDKEWIHDKHELSIKENRYGTDRFHELFEAIFKVEFEGVKTCYISGVRAEESPRRKLAMTQDLTYKDITWGKRLFEKYEHYTFYPIYDWSYTDVWKCIHEHKWNYNKVYDEMYRHRVPINEMRISNLHHETAIQSMLYVQEIEPLTWEKISSRINGANTIKHLQRESFQCPKELPFMFATWEEYALHLVENIIQDQKNKDLIYRQINNLTNVYTDHAIREDFFKVVIKTVLSSDWDLTKLKNWTEGNKDAYIYREFKKGNVKDYMMSKSKYVTNEMRQELQNKINDSNRGNN